MKRNLNHCYHDQTLKGDQNLTCFLIGEISNQLQIKIIELMEVNENGTIWVFYCRG